MSRKIIKKNLIASPCDWLVGYYSFTNKVGKNWLIFIYLI